MTILLITYLINKFWNKKETPREYFSQRLRVVAVRMGLL